MIYKYEYITPDKFDDIILLSDGEYLTGLLFTSEAPKDNYEIKELSIFLETKKYLDIYFSGKIPDFTPKYKIDNLTPFQKEVLSITKTIPFGKVLTYKNIADEIAHNRKGKMSSQAVGGALHVNPICIIIPCHRVIGTNNKLIGYGGGINNKKELLIHEGSYNE